MKGNVGKYNPSDGRGDIYPDDEKGEVPFAKSQIVGRKSMPHDQRVEFELELGPKGPEAVSVRRVEDNSD